MSKLITGLTIHTGDSTIAQGAVLIEHGKIARVFNANEHLPDNVETVAYPADHHLIPGMIDMHIHGSRSADVMDATPEALQTIADSLLQQGTVAFLGSTMTDSSENIERALLNAAAFQQSQNRGAKLVGIHLEGPFIAPEYTGAQSATHISAPNVEQFKHWQSLCGNLIKMVTLAPEQPNGLELIDYLKATNVIASFGHSAADYVTTQAAIDRGVTQATHLFNAMRGIHHREPGAVTALLLRDEVYAELIADGNHLAPSIIDLSYRLKTADKLILVTDATRAQCCSDGCYELGGQEIFVKDNAVRLKNGTLAGSIITLPQAIPFVMQATGCDLNDIIKMVSTNPAHQLRLKNHGKIAVGYQAQLSVLDSKFKVIAVYFFSNRH